MGRVASFLLVGNQPWCERMVRSVKTVTGYRIVQMSDLETSKVNGVDEVVRIGKDMELMPFRLLHLASYPHDEMLILDTDILLRKPVEDVWARDFEIALCHREESKLTIQGTDFDVAKMMPFNTGVMFSRSQEFWAHCAVWLSEQPLENQKWWGDQMAVAQMAPKFRTLVLPSQEFNWTPKSADDQSDARVWHYKGTNRKEWMLSDCS